MTDKFLFDPDSNALNRLDYRPSEYLISDTKLHFDLDEERTRVKSELSVYRNPEVNEGGPLILDGEDMKLVSIKIDGKPLDRKDFEVTKTKLIIKRPPEQDFKLEIENEINPSENTLLEGLYIPDGEKMFCTQCEAQGFRRITYFLDRPDVLSKFDVTVEADKEKFPILLSNGNGDPTKTKDLGNGRHQINWKDPHPKPSYLFALVAGDLPYIEDTYTTNTGRDITFRIFVPEGYEKKVEWAMDSIKRAMRWDEDTYGREYDLDVFHIVATPSFNMGAMENKGLNVFNISILAGDPETATDSRLIQIEAVIGHEHFHNWSGNRVTLRDWFELTLKEGFTVLRDRQFTADMHSKPLKDIEDAKIMKAVQFMEDSGPTSHSIRPDWVAEFDNIYTTTIYQKGSHVLGMMRTFMGDEKWREATDEYFSRFDGKAVTCDDFVDVMEDVSGIDLSQFRLWYSQSGTPEISYSLEYDEDNKICRLTLEQKNEPTADQKEKKPLHMPISVGLIGKDGKDIPLKLVGENGEAETTKVLHLREEKQVFEFENITEEVVPSILRSFSAPVKITTKPSEDELVFRMKHDSDGYNRFEAAQEYMTKALIDMVNDIENGREAKVPEKLQDVIGHILTTDAQGEDKAFIADMIRLPSYRILMQELKTVNPDAVMDAIDTMKEQILKRHSQDLTGIYKSLSTANDEKYEVSTEQVGRRSLRNLTLSYLMADAADNTIKLAKEQYDNAQNMTERLGAISALTETDSEETKTALDDFYKRYRDDTNVMDTWLSLQAGMEHGDALARVKELMEHEVFSIKTPNKVRAVVGTFTNANPRHFHREDGEGYKFLADIVIKMNEINPRMGAGLVKPLLEWKRYDDNRGQLMLEQLERIRAVPDLSSGIKELVDKSLALRNANGKEHKNDNKHDGSKPSGSGIAA